MSKDNSDSEDIENFGIRESRVEKDRMHKVIMASGHKIVVNIFSRVLGVTTKTLLTITIFVSVLLYLLLKESRDYNYLSFEFNSHDVPFQTHVICIFIINLLIAVNSIFIIYSLLSKKDDYFLSVYYEDISHFHIFTDIILIALFVTGMIYTKTFYSQLLIFILSLSSLICVGYMYRKIKTRKNFSIPALFGHKIQLSVMMSLLTYLVLFGLMDLIMYGREHDSEYHTLKETLSIIANCIYACGAIVCISTVKDITFSLVMFVIEIGFLVNANDLASSENVTVFSIMGFIFVAILITVIKYRKLAWGYEDTEELIEDLRKAHDLISNK